MSLANIEQKFSPNKQRNYWTWKHKAGAGGPWEIFVEKAIEESMVLMQYEYVSEDTGRVTENWNKVQLIKPGDIIFLRGDDKIYAYGEVIMPRGECNKKMQIKDNLGGVQYNSTNSNDIIHFTDIPFYENLKDGHDGNWGQRIDIEQWHSVLPLDKGIYAKDENNYEGSCYTVMRKVKTEKGPLFVEELEKQLQDLIMENIMKDYGFVVANGVKTLPYCHNIILTGAPGTGKTYAATQIAELLTEPSGGNKEENICQVQFHPGYDYSDFIIGLKPKVIEGQVTFDWQDGVLKNFVKKALEERELAEQENRLANPYIFIIDEINRADLSRVFGEVFSLLEEEYRYPKNTKGITLPNGENFILPDNLYIIGTMNDIDRSVESMDFALRRRFSWYEVKAEDSKHIIDAEKNGVFKITDENHRKALKNAMTELNKYIGGEEKEEEKLEIKGQKVSLNLGDEYKLGGAYFLNFAKYQDKVDAWDKLWNNHIVIILNEYLRGHKLRSDIVIALREKYDACVR